MTSHERVIAATRGGVVDQRPVLSYPEASADADIIVSLDLDGLSAAVDGNRVVLSLVDSPFRRCGLELASEFRDNPDAASSQLDAAVDAARTEMSTALEKGADGIFYRLFGARESRSTPMEYGGLYLERDRELLEEVQDATLNVLFLVGNDDLYMDFVSDLPAHVIAWDREATGITSEEVRKLRSGAQASSDPSSEIQLEHAGIRIADLIDTP